MLDDGVIVMAHIFNVFLLSLPEGPLSRSILLLALEETILVLTRFLYMIKRVVSRGRNVPVQSSFSEVPFS